MFLGIHNEDVMLAPPTSAIPPRRCHDIGEHIMKSVISHDCDIRSYWYQRAISWLICSDFMCLIIRYWYQRRFCMIWIWYRIWYGMMIAQERQKWIWYCQDGYNIRKKLWYHVWCHTFLYDISSARKAKKISYMISCMISYIFLWYHAQYHIWY